MKYLDGEELTKEEIKAALRKATISNEIVPVVCGSSYKNRGVQKLLDAIVDYMPAPTDVAAIKLSLIHISGTQLTMRTFHTGGIASAEDITQGLPRVEELFESRRPKAMAIMSEIAGTVHIDDTLSLIHISFSLYTGTVSQKWNRAP